MGGQETWVASDLALEMACTADAEVKVRGEKKSGLPLPQSLCRGNPDLKHFGHSDHGKRKGEGVNLEGP